MSRLNRVITVRPPATVLISLTSVTHTLSQTELMGSDITEALGETSSRTASSAPPSVRPLVKAPSAATGAAVVAAVIVAFAMSTMGVVAATAKPMHVTLKASATATLRPTRDKRATWTAMGADTRER